MQPLYNEVNISDTQKRNMNWVLKMQSSVGLEDEHQVMMEMIYHRDEDGNVSSKYVGDFLTMKSYDVEVLFAKIKADIVSGKYD